MSLRPTVNVIPEVPEVSSSSPIIRMRLMMRFSIVALVSLVGKVNGLPSQKNEPSTALGFILT